MVQIIAITFTIFFISLYQQTCAINLYDDQVGFVSSVASLIEFGIDLTKTEFDQNVTLQTVLMQSININDYFTKTMMSIERLPGFINFLRKKKRIISNFNFIEESYKEALDLKSQLENNIFYTYEEYKLRTTLIDKTKEHFDDICNLWVNEWAPTKFIEDIEVYENVCANKLSNIQLLDRIFVYVRLATVKYYLTRLAFIYPHHLYKTQRKPHKKKVITNLIQNHENLVRAEIKDSFRKAAKDLKSAMNKTSGAYWNCDPRDYHNEDKSPPHLELPVYKNGIIKNPTDCEKVLDGVDNTDVYVNIAPIKAYKDHVVIGVKFECINRILSLKIKQAKLLPNGLIDSKTIGWLENNYNKSVKNDNYTIFETLRSSPIIGFDLTDVKLRDNHVITGVQFKKRKEERRMYISVESTEIDFRKGKFIGSPLTVDAPEGKDLLRFNDLDSIPTEAEKEITINSNNNQYFKFKTIENDYKRNFAPFIDTTEVLPNTILSGIGLVHKGLKKGSAGFLGLKLFTFNIAPYVLEYPGLQTKKGDFLFIDVSKVNTTYLEILNKCL